MGKWEPTFNVDKTETVTDQKFISASFGLRYPKREETNFKLFLFELRRQGIRDQCALNKEREI